MAERRRRRRLSEDESGEEVSEDIKDTETRERLSECESEDEHLVEDVDVSDYESVTEGKEPEEDGVDNEDDDESEEESEEDSEDESEEEETSEEDEEEDDSDVGVDYADDGLEEERQSGDGEEQPGEEKDKELDDDEDRRNPAYVPRRGAFYEHDTRITEDTEKEQQRLAPKKKLWKDEGKWQHDRFREDQQAPKSREELMVIYGYDILASDQPPAAPPRINKSRVRNSQRRQQLKDFIGDPKWSGRRTSPDVQQKNYRNRRPTRGGGRNRLGDYGDSRREYGDNRHEQEKLDHNTGPSKAENVTRPKRYSTQRQRNMPEVNYPDQIPVDGTTYYSPISTTGIPSPPRMFGPAPVPVSIATAPPVYVGFHLYIGASIFHHHLGLTRLLQQNSFSRSSCLVKSAIPIINPQDVKDKKFTSANETDSNNYNSHDKDQEESTITNVHARESVDFAPESSSCSQTASETPTSRASDSTSLSLSRSASSAVISKEKSSSEEEDTNSSSITAHKPVDLADTCTPSEQATQPILEAAA
ncbi:CASC3 [Acanthosepion pharaonis]|uniref:Protein CASC3 n=1 Tax=Acanthosepion pharaonis TaxID=158019 RepID=A0A812CHZ3_ACAPH|nr:CASC3 [Sepia pharaonis]